jgi:hypothetical protein
LSQRWIWGPGQVVFCAWFSGFFLYLNYMPLFYTDVWGHASYGQWILEHRQLPLEDPFVSLAEGVRVVDSAWLSQLILGLTVQAGGAAALSTLFALVVLATYLLLARTFHLEAGRIGVTLSCVLLALGLEWLRIAVIRPEMFGMLCCSLLLLGVTQAELSRSRGVRRWLLWGALPIVMAAWANLHGSFVVGLALVGCQLLGRVLEVGWKARSLTAALRAPEVRDWLIATELAISATLLNPYGIDLLINTVSFAAHPNLRDILEWQQLDVTSPEALGLGFSWVLLAFLLRHSRSPVRPAQALGLGLFSLAAVLNVRLSAWYGLVFVWAMAPHLAGLVERWRPQAISEEGGLRGGLLGRTFHHTLICGLLAWLAFAFAPLSSGVLGGRPRTAAQLYSAATPHGLTEFLRRLPPRGQIWNPQMWGDWLVWDGPPGLRVFMTTNSVHLAPPQVWKDYLRIGTVSESWQPLLDKYRVTTLVVDKLGMPKLEAAARLLPGWKVIYEDRLALVVARATDGMPSEPHAANSRAAKEKS